MCGLDGLVVIYVNFALGRVQISPPTALASQHVPSRGLGIPACALEVELDQPEELRVLQLVEDSARETPGYELLKIVEDSALATTDNVPLEFVEDVAGRESLFNS